MARRCGQDWVVWFFGCVSCGCTSFGFQPATPPQAPLAKLGAPEGSQVAAIRTVSVATSSGTQQRLDHAGQQLLQTNAQTGLRLTFVAQPEDKPLVRSEGEHRVIVSDALIQATASEAQLAGVVALEMASIVAKRENMQDIGGASPERAPPMDVRIGQDGASGYADQTYVAELTKLGYDRKKGKTHPTPPDVEKLARSYLAKAGYGEAEFAAAYKLWTGARTTSSVR